MDGRRTAWERNIRRFLLWGVGGSVVFMAASAPLGWHDGFSQLDTAQHVIAGVIVASFFLYWMHEHDWFGARPPLRVQWAVILGFVMLIGVGWEFFEFWFDEIVRPSIAQAAAPAQPSVQDTMADLIMDAVGGLVGLALFARSRG